jgi:serine/threonine protein kinase
MQSCLRTKSWVSFLLNKQLAMLYQAAPLAGGLSKYLICSSTRMPFPYFLGTPRDLKPEHVLIANDGVRVADFSSAACLPNAPPARPPLRPDISQRAETLRRSLELLHARHHRQTRSGPPTPDKEGGKGHQQQHQQEEEEGERQQQQEQQQGEQHHDVLNYRVGSMEYMAPEMLAKPTAAEVFHLVRTGAVRGAL